MPVSDDTLSQYIEEFQESADEEWQQERLEKKQEIRTILTQDDWADFDKGGMRELVRNLWAFETWNNKDYIVDQTFEEGEDAVRERLREGTADTDDFAHAYDSLSSIPQFGSATASEILSFIHPSSCAIYNRPTREGLAILSYDSEVPSRINSGDDYETFLRTMEEVLGRVTANKNTSSPTVALDDFIDLDYFLYWLAEEKEDVEEEEDTDEEWSHDDMMKTLMALGDGLGFKVQDEYAAAPRADIDVVWKTQIANLGSVGYAFEVHHKGSEDSAILNLQKAINEDPEIQRGVLVSDPDQLEGFREELNSLGDFASDVSYLPVADVEEADRLITDLLDILRDAQLTI